MQARKESERDRRRMGFRQGSVRSLARDEADEPKAVSDTEEKKLGLDGREKQREGDKLREEECKGYKRKDKDCTRIRTI
ncbi:hypothetical protein Q3G72_025042 [Acer saccharum]|nr:hypothetical protein Q3G72_025042 [Acer saccharum]